MGLISTEEFATSYDDSRTQEFVRVLSEDIEELGKNPKNVRFNDLARICNRHFGEPRQKGTSHRNYSMPWPGDPRVNIQDKKGVAKPFQVRQVIKALEKLKELK